MAEYVLVTRAGRLHENTNRLMFVGEVMISSDICWISSYSLTSSLRLARRFSEEDVPRFLSSLDGKDFEFVPRTPEEVMVEQVINE